MLRFFRINDPYRLLAILVLLVLFALPVWLSDWPLTPPELLHQVLGESIAAGHRMYVEVYDATAPFAAGIFGGTDWLFGRSLPARQVLTLLLLFFQAAFFVILLINNKAYNDNTYVPGLVFGLLCFLSYDFLSYSPELFGSTLLLLALNNLFREIEFRIQREETILSLGVYLGAASIFVFTYAIFLVGALMILVIYTRISLRKVLLIIFGFLLPHLILFLIYLRWDALRLLWENFYLPNLVGQRQLWVSWRSVLYLLALPAGYFVISLFMLTREARFTKYQSQLFQVMFWWLLIALVEIMVTKSFTPHSFITTVPSLTYFVSHYLLLIRRRWIAEMMFLLFMGGILLISNLARTGRLSAIDYSAMKVAPGNHSAAVAGKKVMVLGNDLPVYLQNRLGGFFLNWPLSRETVAGMEYYDHVVKVNEAFLHNPPDVVIDHENLMPGVMERIPLVKETYRKQGNYYWRVP